MRNRKGLSYPFNFASDVLDEAKCIYRIDKKIDINYVMNNVHDAEPSILYVVSLMDERSARIIEAVYKYGITLTEMSKAEAVSASYLGQIKRKAILDATNTPKLEYITKGITEVIQELKESKDKRIKVLEDSIVDVLYNANEYGSVHLAAKPETKHIGENLEEFGVNRKALMKLHYMDIRTIGDLLYNYDDLWTDWFKSRLGKYWDNVIQALDNYYNKVKSEHDTEDGWA